MSEEIQEQKQPVKKGVFVWIVITVVIASRCEDILRDIVGMPPYLAVLIADSFILLIVYRFLRTPKLNFILYAIYMESVIVGHVLSLYVVIPYLKTFLSPGLAYGIPL